MRKSVSLLCLLVACLTGCSSVATVVKRTAAARPADFVVWPADFRSDTLNNSYYFTLTTPKNTVTGLFFLKKSNDEWQGTLVNEIGMRAFRFVITDEKCEMLNVIPMMDKWYIKKTVAEDLYLLIQIDNPDVSFHKRLERFEQQGLRVVNYKRKQVIAGQDGAIRLINKRRNLLYELRKIVELDPDKKIL